MAVLLYGIDKNHALEDCNKRTALLALLYQLDRNGLTLRCHKRTIEELCVRIAANQLHMYQGYKNFARADEPEIEFIAHFLRINTHKLDKRFYILTYTQFNQRLNKFGYKLDNPQGNYIDVVRLPNTKKIFGIISKKTKEQKVYQVGFPGWKKQVNEKAAKCILKACKLTEKDGIDSDVFFNDEIPMFAIIEEFKGPQTRLKDR